MESIAVPLETAVDVASKRKRVWKTGIKSAKISLDQGMMAQFRPGDNLMISVADGELVLKPTKTEATPGHFVIVPVSMTDTGRGTARLNQYAINRLAKLYGGVEVIRDLLKPGQRVFVQMGGWRKFSKAEHSDLSYTITKV